MDKGWIKIVYIYVNSLVLLSDTTITYIVY
jgi:hypothetical protein